jgi:ATP adenylyltransferase
MLDKERHPMNFENLKKFINSKMVMSHIYQPLLIRNLVDSGGQSTIRQLAVNFASYDESFIVQYEAILKSMPIKILMKHGVITRDKDIISLSTGKLTLQEKAEIRKICESKLQDYIVKRGLSIWDYRLLDEPVSDLLALRVLRDAKGRCALCGATKDESPLHIDHIIPRSKGGKTEYSNLQVLCAQHNLAKSNKEDVDYRNIVEANKLVKCIFCQIDNREISAENEYAFATPDGYAVTLGHTLVIPKRHVQDYFDLSEKERESINNLLRALRKLLIEKDKSISGFNVGVNCGESAGQSIMHCHIHLIPRRKGDVQNPRGGVRGVIPSRMNY